MVSEAGADALGVNLWPGSKRGVTLAHAVEVVAAIPPGVLRFGVFVNPTVGEVEEAVVRLRLDHVQLHGDEDREGVARCGRGAFKALRLSAEEVLEDLEAWPGPFVLVDAYAAGVRGGAGVVADWSLAAKAARRRDVWLAGGLRPGNVAAALEAVRPFGVDVASGVESAPGVKDRRKVRAFLQAAGRL